MNFEGLRLALQATQASDDYRCRVHLRQGGNITSKNSMGLRTQGSVSLRSRDDSR